MYIYMHAPVPHLDVCIYLYTLVLSGFWFAVFVCVLRKLLGATEISWPESKTRTENREQREREPDSESVRLGSVGCLRFGQFANGAELRCMVYLFN